MLSFLAEHGRMQDQVRRSDTTATGEDESSGGEAAAASEEDASETFSPISSLIRGPEQEAELRDRIRLARSAAAAIELEPCSTIITLSSNQRPHEPSEVFLISQCPVHYSLCWDMCDMLFGVNSHLHSLFK